MAAEGATFFEVSLVVFFGAPEGLGGDDLGDDGLRILFLVGEAGDKGFRGGFLLGGMEEDDAAILSAPVRALAVELGGIVEGEELLEEAVVR